MLVSAALSSRTYLYHDIDESAEVLMLSRRKLEKLCDVEEHGAFFQVSEVLPLTKDEKRDECIRGTYLIQKVDDLV